MFFAGAAYSQDVVIMAKKITEDIPVDTEAAVWNAARAVEVPLASQVMARPREYEASVKGIKVRAIHNSKDIGFLLEWKDETKDLAFEVVHTFSDGAALQFPSKTTGILPHFGMGHDEGIVNIWNWKAVFQENGKERKVYAMVDEFLAGREAGNPLSIQINPVQNLIAGGFGTLTAMEEKEQAVSGIGKWEAGAWKVVFKRAINGIEEYGAQFEEGKLTPVAFAVWDGANMERGARKAVSTWYYAAFETETPATVYIYPAIAFVGAAVFVILLILHIRKRIKG